MLPVLMAGDDGFDVADDNFVDLIQHWCWCCCLICWCLLHIVLFCWAILLLLIWSASLGLWLALISVGALCGMVLKVGLCVMYAGCFQLDVLVDCCIQGLPPFGAKGWYAYVAMHYCSIDVIVVVMYLFSEVLEGFDAVITTFEYEATTSPAV